MLNDFLDIQETENALLSIIIELGEDIYFVDENEEPTFYAKMSLDTTVSKSVNIHSKEYKFVGVMTFEDRTSMEVLKGAYFKRAVSPLKTYMLLSTTENPFSSKYADVEVIECNDTIDIGYLTTQMNPDTFNEEEVVEILYPSVKVNTSISQRTQQETQVGSIPKSVLDIVLPSKYMVTTSNYVFRKEFVGVGEKNTITQYKKQTYNIEDVNDTLVNTLDGTTFYGVLELQLTKKV